MPKMVCTDCQTEYKILKSGGYVLEMFSSPPQPYKIWAADVWECRGCGKKVVAGFGQNPLAEHWQDHFPETLERVKASPAAQQGYLIYDYERPQKGEANEPQKT